MSRPSTNTRLRAAGIAALVAGLPLCASPAQPAVERAGDDAVAALVGAIREEQRRNGPYSLALLGPLRVLVRWYEENDDPDLADAMLEQALLIVRANFGLHSLEQAPLLQRRIRHEQERGNHALAWDLEHQLLDLVERNPDDLRGVAVLRAAGDDRLEVLARYQRGEFPPQLVLGCYYNAAGLASASCTSGSRRKAVKAILADAQRQYSEAVEVLVRNAEYSSDDLRTLESAIVHASYREGNYAAGRESLRRAVEHATRAGESPRSVLEVAVEVGDWDLTFGESARGLREYEAAVRRLEQHGAAAEIEALFAPAVPVALPTFMPNPLLTSPAGDPGLFIDIAFDISRFGRSSRARILATTTHPSAEARDALEQLVLERRFRPQLRNGEFVDTRVVVRYYPAP